MTEPDALDIIAPLAERLDKLIVAVEKLVVVLRPSDLAAYRQSDPLVTGSTAGKPEPQWPTNGPVDPEPPFPGPSPEFRQSRDLPAEPFAPFPRWSCPTHHSSKVVPAGVSKKTGKPYQAFVVCGEQGCEQRPPR